MDYTEIVKKLIGPVQPVGETRTDEQRLGNLKEMCQLVYDLILEINLVAQHRDRPEQSMKRAGTIADNVLKDIKK